MVCWVEKRFGGESRGLAGIEIDYFEYLSILLHFCVNLFHDKTGIRFLRNDK